mmetsp:Transcript_14017/g.46767  ORF Transcript_14017/g.46767 Transcript_14017/m.46767 type:complete len:203 (+) Transcript_14017:3126-3734(+)
MWSVRRCVSGARVLVPISHLRTQRTVAHTSTKKETAEIKREYRHIAHADTRQSPTLEDREGGLERAAAPKPLWKAQRAPSHRRATCQTAARHDHSREEGGAASSSRKLASLRVGDSSSPPLKTPNHHSKSSSAPIKPDAIIRFDLSSLHCISRLAPRALAEKTLADCATLCDLSASSVSFSSRSSIFFMFSCMTTRTWFTCS